MVTDVASALHIERLGMTQVGRFSSGAPLDEAAVDLANPTTAVRIASLPAGGDPDGVAVHRRVLAVAAADPSADRSRPWQ